MAVSLKAAYFAEQLLCLKSNGQQATLIGVRRDLEHVLTIIKSATGLILLSSDDVCPSQRNLTEGREISSCLKHNCKFPVACSAINVWLACSLGPRLLIGSAF